MCILLMAYYLEEILKVQNIFQTELLNGGIFLLTNFYFILIFKRKYEKIFDDPFFPEHLFPFKLCFYTKKIHTRMLIPLH